MQYYLDHNATTPMCDQAISAMEVVHRNSYGNASSVHLMGAGARQLLEAARESLAGMIGCEPGELYFTSGGTEANNGALWGILGKRPHWGPLHSAVEHKSIINAAKLYAFGRTVNTLAVDEDGIVDIDILDRVLRNYPRDPVDYLVSVMMANNETGVIQPIRDVVSLLREIRPESLIHVDAVQAFGKIPVDVKDLDVDLMTISAHKLGGPKGIGALYVRKGVEILPILVGGHQEGDLRAGTENVAAAVGFQVAASQRNRRRWEYWDATSAHVRNLLDLLKELGGWWINGGDRDRLPNTVNIGFEGVDSDALVLMLSAHEVFVSNGSACEAGSDEGSHVLRAMGQDDEKSRSAIRFSFSDDLPEGAIPEIANYVISTVKLLRDMNKIVIPDSIA